MRRCAAAAVAALSRSLLPRSETAASRVVRARPYCHLSAGRRRPTVGRSGPPQGELSATITVGFLSFFFLSFLFFFFTHPLGSFYDRFSTAFLLLLFRLRLSDTACRLRRETPSRTRIVVRLPRHRPGSLPPPSPPPITRARSMSFVVPPSKFSSIITREVCSSDCTVDYRGSRRVGSFGAVWARF